jgi:hypothetical protein
MVVLHASLVQINVLLHLYSVRYGNQVEDEAFAWAIVTCMSGREREFWKLVSQYSFKNWFLKKTKMTCLETGVQETEI